MTEHAWITEIGLREAATIVYEHLNGKEWPEDEWFRIGESLDVNLWKNKAHNTLYATLYPVVDGETDTSRWVRVFQDDRWRIP